MMNMKNSELIKKKELNKLCQALLIENIFTLNYASNFLNSPAVFVNIHIASIPTTE